MALVRKCVVTEPSSFEEAVEDPAWVDAMVEEYDSIVRKQCMGDCPETGGEISGGFEMDLQSEAGS